MAKPKQPNIPESIEHSLKVLADHFNKEDQAVRERQLRLWKKLNYYWCGFTRIWWSDVAHDWRIFDAEMMNSDDQAYYDKSINVFRAFLETIIAAMSVTVPPVRCLPDDADNINDVLTAKGGTKIAELIYKHNDAPLLWCKALWIYCTQGMIAGYNYAHDDPKFGLVSTEDYADVEETVDQKVCPSCGTPLDEQNLQTAIEMEMQEANEYNPGPDDTILHNLINEGKILCPQCQIEVDPETKQNKIIVTRLTGITDKAKTRQCIEVNGGLFVKVPCYAKCQADIPYLRYSYETHYSNVLKKYPWMRDQLDINSSGTGSSTGSGYDLYERWARLSPQYYGEYPLNTPTVSTWWFRPSAFEVIFDDDDREELEKKYPDGCKAVFINDKLATAENAALDDAWTLTYNPLSEYIHFDPLGLLLTSIQEITEDLISLTLQTIEHGIPQTFADPNVLNFDQYRKTEATPGQIFPAKAKSGKTLAEAFYEVKTAALSQEVGPFGEKINELGQFVSGALPSLSGGNADNSSKTAAQYQMSRQQAMQRLQTPWKMINFWWKNIFAKVIPAYIKTMLEDERVVKSDGNDFINVVIKKSELDGKIGDIEIECDDQLPMSAEQIKDVIMQLINLNNDEVHAMLTTPENLPYISEAIGLTNFHMPGEDDREKQREEIKLLLNSTPMPGMNGQEMPSIEPEQNVDNDQVHAEICRSFLVSEAGRQAKVDNSPGYKNVLLHLQAHTMVIQQAQMQQQQQQMMMQAQQEQMKQGAGGAPNQPPNKEMVQ